MILYILYSIIAFLVLHQVWTGIIKQYYDVYYYKRQGVPFLPGIWPILGNLPFFLKIQKEVELGEISVIAAPRIYYGKNVPGAVGFVFQKQVSIVINDPEMLEVLYVQQNKYFDKHPRVYYMSKPIMGETILLTRSTSLWQAKRKVLATAFYKDKLSKMMDVIRGVVLDFVKGIERDYIATGKQFNLAGKLGELQVKIILNCAFGVDLGESEMEYEIDGKMVMKKYSYILKELTNRAPNRTVNLPNFLYPSLVHYYITPSDREFLRNIKRVRGNLRDLILQKKAAGKNDDGDLMTILINDEIFKDDIDLIIDECLAFFLAGTQTTSSAVGTTISNAIKDPKIMGGILSEIRQFCRENQVQDLYDVLSLDSLSDLSYLQMCFNEAMRWEAPLSRSTSMMVTEDVKLPGFVLRAGDIFAVDMYALHRREDQWIQPELYIPERFDAQSPYYLTPSGKKRHPFAFSPFLGGKRICIGKTFAETSSKFICALFINKCGQYLQFVDKKHYQRLPRNNALLSEVPELLVHTGK